MEQVRPNVAVNLNSQVQSLKNVCIHLLPTRKNPAQVYSINQAPIERCSDQLKQVQVLGRITPKKLAIEVEEPRTYKAPLPRKPPRFGTFDINIKV